MSAHASVVNQSRSLIDNVSVQLQRHLMGVVATSVVLIDEFAYEKTDVAPQKRLKTLLNVPLNVFFNHLVIFWCRLTLSSQVPFPTVTKSNYVELRYVVDVVCHIAGEPDVHVPGTVLIFDSPVTYTTRNVVRYHP